MKSSQKLLARNNPALKIIDSRYLCIKTGCETYKGLNCAIKTKPPLKVLSN